MKELLAAIEDTNNVKSLLYDVDTGVWIISYKSDLPDDKVDSDNLIDFLNYA